MSANSQQRKYKVGTNFTKAGIQMTITARPIYIIALNGPEKGLNIAEQSRSCP